MEQQEILPIKDSEIEYIMRYLLDNLDKNSMEHTMGHSVKVGFLLGSLYYDRETIIAGFLHDIIEDSDVSKKDLEYRFGMKVGEIVQANTFDYTIDKKSRSIESKIRRHQDCFNHCVRSGREALLVKAADLYVNSFEYKLFRDDTKVYDYLIERLSEFLELSESIIGKEKIWKMLRERRDILSVVA